MADVAVMELLAEHVPLSLIMDLVMPAGPHSTELLLEEGHPIGGWQQGPEPGPDH
jgi:hypothetical protein